MDNRIWVETLVSSQTQKGMVQIAWYDHRAQLEPQTARELAIQLLEAAEAARSDEITFAFAKKSGASDKEAAHMLHIYRELRQAQEQEAGE